MISHAYQATVAMIEEDINIAWLVRMIDGVPISVHLPLVAVPAPLRAFGTAVTVDVSVFGETFAIIVSEKKERA